MLLIRLLSTLYRYLRGHDSCKKFSSNHKSIFYCLYWSGSKLIAFVRLYLIIQLTKKKEEVFGFPSVCNFEYKVHKKNVIASQGIIYSTLLYNLLTRKV